MLSANSLFPEHYRYILFGLITDIVALLDELQFVKRLVYFLSSEGSRTMAKSFSNLAISFASLTAGSGGGAPFFSYNVQQQ